MTVAQPLTELKILVHPALLDTPLGCRIVEVDRWVDTYARRPDNVDVQREQLRVGAETELYRLAWAARFLVLLDRVVREVDDDKEYVSQLQLRRQQVIGEAENALALFKEDGSLPTSDSLRDRRTSVLAAKPEFYDGELVGWLAQCVGTSQTAAEVQTCISGSAQRAIQYIDRADIHRWQSEPPKFELWSGVREASYDRCTDVSCLLSPSATDDQRLWPLDFMLQVAFTTPPGFLPGEDRPEEYVDAQPFEFPTLHDNIRNHVAAAVTANSELSAILSDLRTFTLLQRLFRVAFAGGLGPDFPMERLVELTRDSAGGIPYSRTPRWNVGRRMLEVEWMGALDHLRPTADEIAHAASAKADPAVAKALAEVLAGIDRCTKELEAVESILQWTILPVERWDRVCRFDGAAETLRRACGTSRSEATCKAAYLARLSGTIAESRRLRTALQVDRDAVPSGPCPPLASVEITSR